MIVTMLEARVAEARWGALTEAFDRLARAPEPRVIESYPMQDHSDPERWRLVAIWASRRAFEEMLAEGRPRGPMIFAAAGIERAGLISFDVRGVRSLLPEVSDRIPDDDPAEDAAPTPA
jgi:hypothetical protein